MILKEYQSIGNHQDRLNFALENKRELIAAKRDFDHTSKAFTTSPQLLKHLETAIKAEPDQDGVYKIVGNAIGFLDGHDDVSMKGSFTKTVKETGKRVKILRDHGRGIDSIIAVNKGLFIEDVDIETLGFQVMGKTEVVGARILPKYDPKIAEMYADGVIDQHSVGIQYVKLDLAVNDPYQEEEYKIWQATIDQVINREEAIERGFYFPIFEQKLKEISAVVFGSNPYTPTMDNKSLASDEPSNDTQPKDEPTEPKSHIHRKLI
ncbi:MAG: hypothetical protein HRT61_00845 [Ekhidna sp.]|nr:hypothetical protein [Ekhidna sp.]